MNNMNGLTVGEDRMNDLISRQAEIDAMWKAELQYEEEYDTRSVYGVLCDAEKNLKNLSSVQPEQRWIPVSQRLPEEGERVLATHLGGVNPNRQVIEHIYQCGKFTCGWDMDMNVDSPTFGQRYMGKVVAWMPLPEPYRENKE